MAEDVYMNKLVKEKVKVSIGTKDNKYYSGYIKSFTEKGLVILDKFEEERYFDFEFIKFIQPFRDNGKKRGEK